MREELVRASAFQAAALHQWVQDSITIFGILGWPKYSVVLKYW